MERALVVGTPPTVQTPDLPLQLSGTPAVPGGDSLSDMERVHIERVLESADWNITQAAEILEIDRGTLYNKIKKYGLSR